MKEKRGAQRSLMFCFCLLGCTCWAQGSPPDVLSQNCNGCHGPDGVSAGESIPTIAGLNFRYLMSTMVKFRREERPATIMGTIAKGYSFRELKQISRYFASKPWIDAPAKISTNKVSSGKRLHHELCEECHQDNGVYQDKEIPRVSGQWPRYTYFQLTDYYHNDPVMPQPPKMKERLEKLTMEDLEALSEFYGSAYRYPPDSIVRSLNATFLSHAFHQSDRTK